MAFTKDLWIRRVKHSDGSVTREKSTRYGKGKRYLAVWIDPDGNEKSKAFKRKGDADRHGEAMETDKARGEYQDPNAGRITFDELFAKWHASLTVDPSSSLRYAEVYRLHIKPVIGRRAVKSLRPSDIKTLLGKLRKIRAASTVNTVLLVIRGVLDLAEADESIKRNPAKSSIIKRARDHAVKVQVWADDLVRDLIDVHPEPFRLLPIVAAGCGMRQGEVFALALEDLDLDNEVIYLRRQIKKLGPVEVFALPKNDRERTIPMPQWVAENLRAFIEANPPQPYTLPWEKPDGKPHTVKLLFRWTDDLHIRARSHSETLWKPVLVQVGVIPEPERDKRGRLRYETDRKQGMHQLRHYYASIQLDAGVSIPALAEALGHHPSVTLSTYGHLLDSSEDRIRRAIDDRFRRE
ncbi:tyrosine-type recombinase/integrase [Nocardiopsis synnemataformans]|uniref:tyrosine-type recombinase/integrase n=1 Tax=Nocardiopsis synnemataformans TaxID=61305 RepID=UPI003EBCA9BA